MRKLVAVMALAAVCLFGVPQNTVISHAESTWQVKAPKKETQGAITYLTYPNADGQTCWLYQIKVAENADVSTLKIPKKIGGLTVTRLGYKQHGDTCYNLFHEYVESYHGGDGSSELTKKVKEIQLPKTITAIESGCFSGFDSITLIKLPPKVTKIVSDVFYGCDSLQSITLPKDLEEMDITAFYQCDKLNNITISEQNAKYIAKNGSVMSKDGKTLYFAYSADNTYKIPASVTLVKSNAFYVCSAKKVQISKNVEELEKWALQSYKIKKVTVSKKNAYFKKDGQSIYRTDDKSLAVAVAPKGEKYIMSDKVEKLTDNVSLVGSVDEDFVHEGVILKELILSKNLKKLEGNFLFDVNYLEKIQFQSVKPPKFEDKYALPIGDMLTKVYIPKKSEKQYKKLYKSYKRWTLVKDNWSVY